MAGNQTDGNSGKANRTSRRSFIRTVGVTATTTAVGTASIGAVSGAENTVDLGAKGLATGDVIDPYLAEFFVDGTEVHVPAGEYDYTGKGLDGEKANCALVGSPDGVTFTRPADAEVEVRPTITATAGTVRIENVTVCGEHGDPESRWRVAAQPGTMVELRDVTLPDGTVEVIDHFAAHCDGSVQALTTDYRGLAESETGTVAETPTASSVDSQPLPVDPGGPTDEFLRQGDTTSPASRPSRIEIAGGGDAEESVSYEFSVSGDLTLDEGRTVVGSGESLRLSGDITAGHVSGQLRDGVDAFFYSGMLEQVEIDGDAAVTVFYGGHGVEE